MATRLLGYDINSLGLIGLGGLLIKSFLGTNTDENDENNGPATANVWGYGVLAGSILTAMFVTFALVSQMSPMADNNSINFVLALFAHSIPSVLLLGILVWIITINSIYYKNINTGKVSDEYFTYSNVSTFLIIIQSVILFKYLTDELHIAATSNSLKKVLETTMASKLSSVTYLLTMMNIMLIGIMTIILKYFSTDG